MDYTIQTLELNRLTDAVTNMGVTVCHVPSRLPLSSGPPSERNSFISAHLIFVTGFLCNLQEFF